MPIEGKILPSLFRSKQAPAPLPEPVAEVPAPPPVVPAERFAPAPASIWSETTASIWNTEEAAAPAAAGEPSIWLSTPPHLEKAAAEEAAASVAVATEIQTEEADNTDLPEPIWYRNLNAVSTDTTATIAAAPVETQHKPVSPVPRVPNTLEEAGLPDSLMEQLILKILYFRGDVMGSDLASAIGLRFSVIEPILESLRRNNFIGVRRSLGMGNISAIFANTDTGRKLALQHLEYNQYAGVAPVPLDEYTKMVKLQSLKPGWLTKEALHDAYRHMVVTDDILGQIGPAVNSGKSFLIYGQPGNGKTYLAEALFNLQTEPIYLPYAIECQGQIIQLYDPIYHKPLDTPTESLSALAVTLSEDMAYDRRWFRCKRPFIVSGGELALDMLDLSYNKGSRVYDAPFQMKANNGIYLIDDFGRQKVTPAEVLNRWIVPMERREDYLNLVTGGKVSVPFEAFLVFSTNLNPEQLGDEAFLRRIQYKMWMKSPSVDEFRQIFRRFCTDKDLPCQPDALDHFLKNYREGGKRLRRCHPRDVITHAIDYINFERLPWRLTPDVLDHAFGSCFTTVNHLDD
jgi:hypothetical protein